jgi:uncharacterized protein involved in exopolysaccharide biosynthesis
VELQVALAGDTAVSPADVDNLLTVLEQRRLDTLAQIEGLADDLLPGSNPVEVTAERPLQAATASLTQEIAALQAELIAQESARDELTAARQLAWETYQSLTRRQAETEIAAQTVGSEVRVASRSAVPERPAILKRPIPGTLPVVCWKRKGMWKRPLSTIRPPLTQAALKRSA